MVEAVGMAIGWAGVDSESAKRLAERMIVELRDEHDFAIPAVGSYQLKVADSPARQDAVSALVGV